MDRCKHHANTVFFFYSPGSPFTNISNLIPAWISNHMHCKVWDGITYIFQNVNSATVEVFTPHFIMCQTYGMPHNIYASKTHVNNTTYSITTYLSDTQGFLWDLRVWPLNATRHEGEQCSFNQDVNT